MSRPLTPMGVVARGVLAGAKGTAAMDLFMYRRYRRDGGTQAFLEWELAGVSDWDDAPAPAQVGRRVVEGLFQVELDSRWARLTANVMHWGYGVAWGVQYAVVAGSRPRPKLRYGLVLGPVVWGSGYVVLPMTGLYKQIWEYDGAALLNDLSAHVVYGVTVAAAFKVLAGRRAVAVPPA